MVDLTIRGPRPVAALSVNGELEVRPDVDVAPVLDGELVIEQPVRPAPQTVIGRVIRRPACGSQPPRRLNAICVSGSGPAVASSRVAAYTTAGGTALRVCSYRPAKARSALLPGPILIPDCTSA